MARLLHDPVGCVNGHSPAPGDLMACCAYASGYGKSALWQANPSMGSSTTAQCAFSQAAALIKAWHLRARDYVYWSGVKENRPGVPRVALAPLLTIYLPAGYLIMVAARR